MSFTNDLESCRPGEPITLETSASPDPFTDLVKTATGCAVLCTDLLVAHGRRALEVSTDRSVASQSYVEWAAADASQVLRLNVYFPADPSTNHRIVQWYIAGDGSCLDLEHRTDGTLRVRSQNGSQIHQTASLPTGRWLRIEVAATFSASTGQVSLRVYDGADSMALLARSDSQANNNLRGTPTHCRIGVASPAANERVVFDDLAARAGLDFIGPVVPAPVPPTVSADSYQAQWYGKPVTVTTTATAAGGGPVGYSWEVQDGIPGGQVRLETVDGTATVSVNRPGVISLLCHVVDAQANMVTVQHTVEWINRAWNGDHEALHPAFSTVAGNEAELNSMYLSSH
ncbi:hypothetical protein GTQ99_00315 [Kineococcus sp. T13]|uniref:hypothetical protein n=1 Tax=Kineococcus vitellinus TaxID=2696565 RepID=UPI0014123AE7|nr:hypothetical protein [Kineococcus vitellinus]NAZ73874.1 hypothetical protein [Kineococcus vitellinus]